MMPATPFCPVCGAANEPARTHCFVCQQLLSPESEARLSQNVVLLHDRYQLGACLGLGGFSAVYYARDLLTSGREVAIKQIQLQEMNPKEVIEATETFNREVRMLSALNHAQVPCLYDYFSDQDHWYLVLEYIDGQTLETFLSMRQQQGNPLQREEILAMTLQLCPVLEYLHSRQPPIIFRDLKPSNIMRLPAGSLCLIDFGIARHYQPGQAQDTQRLGSPGYAAPEQYGRAQTTPQSDIYSLGALLHFLLSGQDPSDRLLCLPPLRLNDQPGNAELEALVTRMLSPNPSERPATIREVATALEAISQQRVIQDAAPLWQSAPFHMPQIQPSSATSQHSLHQPMYPGPLSSPSAKRRITRRGVLIGLGALTTIVAGTAIRNWWITTPHPFSYVYRGHSETVTAVAWSPDSKRIASASYDRTVQVWDATDGTHVFTYRGKGDVMPGQPFAVFGVAWSPDGKRIASTYADSTVHVWDAADAGNLFIHKEHSFVGYPTDVDAVGFTAWSPDGKRIATASYDGTVQVWDATDGGNVFTYRGHSNVVFGVAPSSDGPRNFAAAALGVTWSPDGKRIASAFDDGIIQVWDVADGGNIFTYRGHSGTVSGVAWSPNGKRIASASHDGTVQVWDATDGTHVFTYRGQALTNSLGGLSGYPNAVAWSPDSKRIVSVGNTMQVWDAADGGHVFTYEQGFSITVAWSPDGKRIASAPASGSEDTAQVWDAP